MESYRIERITFWSGPPSLGWRVTHFRGPFAIPDLKEAEIHDPRNSIDAIHVRIVKTTQWGDGVGMGEHFQYADIIYFPRYDKIWRATIRAREHAGGTVHNVLNDLTEDNLPDSQVIEILGNLL